MLDTYEIGAGTVLADRYEVIRRLGAGGMATVYLAEDAVLERQVAVKRLRGEGADGDLERFRREARLGATLSHPNAVTVFDTISGEDGVLIVMEYVEGETLDDALDGGPLPTERAIEVLRGVANALDHAHANGVVHRDVKPANVLLGDDGTVKLADLGIATAAEATRITTANDIVGTLAYISPERLDSGSAGGPESDVYGLAVLAYEALAGESLDRGSTPAEVVHRATTTAPPDLRDSWSQAPPGAAEAIKAGMDRDPARRPASAGELVDELARALRSERVDTEEFDLPPPPPRTEEPPARRPGAPRAALAAMVAIGVAGLAALVIAIAAGGEDEPTSESTPVAGGGEPSEEQPAEPSGSNEDEVAPAPEEPAPSEDAQAAAPAADPVALNQQGFDLIQEGRYEEAIPILEQAVDSYPEGSTDLEYGYALFNLGNALREAGRPDEAIPILEERLEIPDQTPEVEQELELAREEAGGA